MIRKDNNRLNSDDWLEKEIARESRISAWDLDEGKRLRMEHEENCDVRELADEHHRRHLASERGVSSDKVEAGAVKWFVIDIFTMFILFAVNAVLNEPVVIPALVLFLAINPGIFIWVFLLKRFPSKAYSKAMFWLAVLLELYLLYEGNYRYLRYILWRFFQ
jgi:hypothetical protein